ncbi:3064_t:CDS:2, partial [Racocetra fulgida]
HLTMSQIKYSTFQPYSYQQPASSISSNVEVDCVNDMCLDNESDECLDNESGENLDNESSEHLNNESHELDNEFDEQSDVGFDKQVELYEGQTFQTIEDAHVAVETFTHSNGFGIRKGRVEKDQSNGHEISRTFLCRHTGKSLYEKKSYKTEESESCRTDCKWKVNVYWSKCLSRYHISTFTDVHIGHTPDPTTIKFIPKNHKLTNKMLEDIKYYTIVGKLNA